MKTKRICKSTVSLLLVFMMLISMLTVGIVSTSAAQTDTAETGATITLYFTRPNDNPNWGDASIYYYCWNSSTSANNGTWPGQAANYYQTNTYNQAVYSASVDTSSYDKIIFNNNGSNQTDTIDLTGLQNGDLIYYENGSLVVPEHTSTTPYDFSFTQSEDRVVYLVDTNSWGSAYCYAWDASDTSVNNTWNGKSMTKVGTHNGYNVYKYTLDNDAYDMVIFNKDDSNKTADLTFQSYSYYDNDAAKWTYVGYTTDDEEDPVYNLYGDFNDWSKTEDVLTATGNANEYSVTLNITAGTYKFKIYESTTKDYYCTSSTVTVNDSSSSVQLYSTTDTSNEATVELVAAGGEYTFTFNDSTGILSITYNSTSGGGETTITDKLMFAMVNEIHYYGVTIDFISSTGTTTTAYAIKESGEAGLDVNRIAKNVNGKLEEWPDSMDDTKPKQWSVYSVDIPADTQYIHFNVLHDGGSEKYWCLPQGDDAVKINSSEDLDYDYHNLYTKNYVYNYAEELYVLYEYNNDDGDDDDHSKGYKSIRKSHEDFFDDEEVIYTVTAVCNITEQENEYDNTIVITPTGSSALLGTTAVDWTYAVYLENGDTDTLLASGLSSTETYPYTMTVPDTDYEFYIVVTPTTSSVTATSDPVSKKYIETTDPVLSAYFDGAHDGKNDPTVVITPHAYLDSDELENTTYTYDVYVNDVKVTDTALAGTKTYTHTIPDGNTDEIYIVVHHSEYGDAQSPAKSYYYTSSIDTVSFEVGFKSSTSYRYIPTVTVNGTSYDMTQGDTRIRYNANRTQDYYWYWATVTVEAGKDAKITFTNRYNTSGATCTLASADIEDNQSYQFATDNLNYGNTAIWYNPTEYTNPAVINFVETATHMVATDTESETLAQTLVAGVTYYMGDADTDGTVSIMDATAIQLALAKKTELSVLGTQLADYSTNNELDIFDATIIQLKLAN